MGPAPRRALRTAPPRSRLLAVPFLLLVLLGTALATAALPFAPVERATTTVTWPLAGEPLESTMLTLLPYRPLALAADLPCDVVREAPDEAVLLSTYPVGNERGQGLTVRATGEERAQVVTEGREVWSGEVPDGEGCALAVRVDGERTRVLVGGQEVAAEQVEPPRVANLATTLPPGTDGVQVRLETDSRYQSSPTLQKRALLVLVGLGALAALLAVRAVDRATPPVAAGADGARDRSARWPQDLVVAAVLGLWVVVGPMMADDGYNVAVAEGFGETGYVGNYYHWYNAPEAPFALVQQVQALLVEGSRAPVALRLPALLAGLVTWLLLSRVLLPRLGGTWRPSHVRWLAVPVLLAWWMPFNNSLRPEPWVAVAGTAVLALAVLAVERGRLLLVAAAGVCAALAVAVAPAGLMAAAPLLVLAPGLLALLRRAPVPWWLAGAVALVPAGAVLGTAVFADQPLAAVVEATRVHQVIGPSVPWWQDVVRYEFLFSLGEMGTAARRLAVLATFAALGLVLLLRHGVRAAGGRLLLAAGACYAVALVLLVLAPSKWTHHFGGTVGFGVLVLVGLAVHGSSALRAERRWGALAAGGSVLAAGVVAAAFAGPNAWWAYGSLEVDPQLPPALAQPLLWAALAVAVLAGAAALRLRRRPPVGVLAAVPPAVLVLGLATSVVVMLGTHLQAARELRGGWSMAGQNLGHLTGGSCGMGDAMEVLAPSPLEVADGLGGARQTRPEAFREGAGSFLPGPGTLPADALRWGTLGTLPDDPDGATGTLTSPWFTVPPLAPGESLGVVVSGRSGGENEVRLETADREAPSRVLDAVRVGEGLDGPYWQQVRAFGDDVEGDLVRVVATDAATGVGGWLAVSQPVVVRPVTVREYAEGRAVHVDWQLRIAFPCLDQVPVRDGLAGLPDLVLTTAPRASAAATYGLALDEDQGGAFALARQVSAPEVVPTRLPFASREAVLRGQDLGTLAVWIYPYRADGYEVARGTETVPGWEWGYHYPVPTVPDPLAVPGPRTVDKGGDAPVLDGRPELSPFSGPAVP